MTPTPGPAASTTLRGRKRERTRRAIFDAAYRLFADEGFDAVTLTRIAAEADVAPATVFTHFASKEEIFFRRREEFRAGLPEALAAAGPAGPDVVEAVRGFYDRAIRTVLHGDDGSCDDSSGDDSSGDEGAGGAAGPVNARTFSRVLLDSPALTRSYLQIAQERQDVMAALLAERAPHADREELRLFAALAGTVGENAFRVVHEGLAAGEPAERVRAAATAALDRGFGRLARAYEGSDVLDAEPSYARH
ncbi:helix-turn-helix domain-containing protein [Streptomyces mashuensis]|nr:TetR/AcrR family transcriptional regulator [Streptomyces mashuensis]